VIVADPALLPVTTVTTRSGVVKPCATKRVDGNTVAIEALLLTSVMNTPPSGAGVPSATGKFVVSPGDNVTLAGKTIPGTATGVTVTLAVALAMFGALAVIATNPAPTPVTGTERLVAPVAKLAATGTEATVGSLELRFTTSPAGAGVDRLSVRFCVVV
jgi:energy-coupling factor transporter transmembrane protein EcfT